MWKIYQVDGKQVEMKEKPSQKSLEEIGVETFNRQMLVYTDEKLVSLTPTTMTAGASPLLRNDVGGRKYKYRTELWKENSSYWEQKYKREIEKKGYIMPITEIKK